jgi:AraC family transcriptional regulator
VPSESSLPGRADAWYDPFAREVEVEEHAEPKAVEFGAYRVIGLRYVGKNENQEIMTLWSGPGGMIARLKEIHQPPNSSLAFGLCRCLPGVTDGGFEYVAAFPATADAPVPDGMVEARIGASTYLAFPAENIEVLPGTFGAAMKWLEAHPEWDTYCHGPDDCRCGDYPWFEMYPATFPKDGKLFVYAPVKRRA